MIMMQFYQGPYVPSDVAVEVELEMVAKPSAEVEVSEVMPEIVESCRSIGPACCALHYVEKRPLRSTPHSAACI
jgi:hypothetical protein